MSKKDKTPPKIDKGAIDKKAVSALPIPALYRQGLNVSFQGVAGAYSQQAALALFPDCQTMACANFEMAFQAVETGEADFAVIPIENSLGGRVSDVHHLLPKTNLYIVGEYFLPINHVLWANQGTQLEDIKLVRSHEQALSQCRENLKHLGTATKAAYDTAGAAKDLAESGSKTEAVLASPLIGDLYGLQALRMRMEDKFNNITRFLVFSARQIQPDMGGAQKIITSLYFDVHSVPAALYKALGGFATNGVNLIRLESYISLREPDRASFYGEIEGHPDQRNVDQSLRELGFYCQFKKIMGVYHASPNR